MFIARYFSTLNPFAAAPASSADLAKSSGQKSYHRKATGLAAQTAKKHAKEHELVLFGSCFCPFVQRVWIALELKGVGYQYVEVDPYKKPPALLEVNPLGLVPALRHGEWACHESTVLVEYLEDCYPETFQLLSGSAKDMARARLWADHVHRKIVPTFYSLLQAQESEAQQRYAVELNAAIEKLVSAADPTGPFFAGPKIGYVDVQLAPWLLRLRRVMTPYRGWPAPQEGSRWARWVEAVEGEEAVKRTVSGDELYLDSYERYAGTLLFPLVEGLTADAQLREPAQYKPGGKRDQPGKASAVVPATPL